MTHSNHAVPVLTSLELRLDGDTRRIAPDTMGAVLKRGAKIIQGVTADDYPLQSCNQSVITHLGMQLS